MTPLWDDPDEPMRYFIDGCSDGAGFGRFVCRLGDRAFLVEPLSDFGDGFKPTGRIVLTVEQLAERVDNLLGSRFEIVSDAEEWRLRANAFIESAVDRREPFHRPVAGR